MADVRTMEFELPGFGGELLRPADAAYDEARALFNGMIDRRPAVIARATSADDVSAAVNVAREQDIALSIYGGGHGVTGSALVDAGICIDLRTMNRVDVDPDQRIARVEGGAKWGAIDAATQEHGLAVTGGRMSDTGIGGLALGSGSGWLERMFGFTCDNLVKAEVVTADGRQVVASDDENPDLFWGLRGGGGNFGVVTAFHLRLHPVGPIVLGGQLMYQRRWRAISCASTATSSSPRPTRSAEGSRSSPRRPRSSYPSRCAASLSSALSCCTWATPPKGKRRSGRYASSARPGSTWCSRCRTSRCNSSSIRPTRAAA
jgi:FAD binding domain